MPRNLPGPISKSKSDKVKFIDDGTVAVSINLKASLIPDPQERPRPRNYNERTSHEMNNLLHHYIRDAEKFTLEYKMIINKEKTIQKIEKMGFSTRDDFL